MAAPADSTASEARSISLIPKDGLGRWKEADYGGRGICEVDNGVLTVGAGDPFTAVVWSGPIGTDAEDALPNMDYRITWEARRVLGTDFFSTLTFPVNDNCCSLVLGGWGGAVTGLSSLNDFDAVNNDTCDSRKFEKDKWYRFTLTVRPDEIAATCDGEELFPPIDPREYHIGTRVEMELAKPLSFSTYLTTGEVKNAKLTPLPPRVVKPLEE